MSAEARRVGVRMPGSSGPPRGPMHSLHGTAALRVCSSPPNRCTHAGQSRTLHVASTHLPYRTLPTHAPLAHSYGPHPHPLRHAPPRPPAEQRPRARVRRRGLVDRGPAQLPLFLVAAMPLYFANWDDPVSRALTPVPIMADVSGLDVDERGDMEEAHRWRLSHHHYTEGARAAARGALAGAGVPCLVAFAAEDVRKTTALAKVQRLDDWAGVMLQNMISVSEQGGVVNAELRAAAVAEEAAHWAWDDMDDPPRLLKPTESVYTRRPAQDPWACASRRRTAPLPSPPARAHRVGVHAGLLRTGSLRLGAPTVPHRCPPRLLNPTESVYTRRRASR
ncbi:hypothetical protein PLICRDRAFT_174449 [Plicaturopsis crispa FD-325 SS-3]|nr:hypothetical protein PLICRDRAFT_174449 [Plicaturopsis crispa FD-325 SS-3]